MLSMAIAIDHARKENPNQSLVLFSTFISHKTKPVYLDSHVAGQVPTMTRAAAILLNSVATIIASAPSMIDNWGPDIYYPKH